MDKDRNKTNASKCASSSAGRCKKPATCTHLRSLRQQQIKSGQSAQVLYREHNCKAHGNDEDVFFDCQSVGDNELVRAGNSCKSFESNRAMMLNRAHKSKEPCLPAKKQSSCFKASSSCNTSANGKFDDPATMRATLERAANATQMLLNNFEKNNRECKCPCKATLEITTRLIIDPKANSSRCRLQGRPVTVQMPLQFDPNTGDMASCTPRPLHKSHSDLSHKGRGSKSHHTKYYDTTDAEDDDNLFKGTCDSKDSLTPYPRAVPVPVPLKRQIPVSEPVPVPVPLPVPLPAPVPEAEPEPDQEPEAERMLAPIPAPVPPPSPVPAPVPDREQKSASVLDVAVEHDTDVEQLQEIVPLEKEESKVAFMPPTEDIATREAEPLKKYYLALPQHKEFSNCSPCRFEPSPIMDEDGNVFCPGNCGCCQCAWKVRSFDENRDRINVKVCRCVQRGTIFTNFDQRETCSQTSQFDFCPCREKAEAKFLELYHTEMWSSPKNMRGRKINLSEIKELRTPPQTQFN